MPPQSSGSNLTLSGDQAIAAKIDEYSALLTKTDRIIHNRHTPLPAIEREYRGLLAATFEQFFGSDYERIKNNPSARESFKWIEMLRNEILHNAQARLVNAQVNDQFRYAMTFPERRQRPEAHIGIEGIPYESAIRWPGVAGRIDNANGLPAYTVPTEGYLDADLERQIAGYRELLLKAGEVISNTNNAGASSYEEIEKAYLKLLDSPPENHIA
jgi:hypothetical protein